MFTKKIINLIWYITLVLLPFTSLPIAGKILHSQMVASPSIIFLGLLAIFWFLPYILTHKLNLAIVPIIVFFAFSILSSCLAFFYNIPIQKNFNLANSSLEAYATLIIGISFFIISLHFIRTNQLLHRSLQLIYLGFFPLFFWSLLQFAYDQLGTGFPSWMVSIQSAISTSGTLFVGRITDFAYEPSWVAHQLNIFYLPLLLGSSLTSFSVIKKRIGFVTLENILLICSIFLLFLSKSRIGWITFIVCAFYVFIVFNKNRIDILRNKYLFLKRKSWNFLMSITLIGLMIGALVTGLFISSKIDPRMEQVLNPKTYQKQSLLSIANEFFFAERILYWQTGWNIFNDYPIMGIGLGNYGYYFEKYMPSFAWALDEPRALIFQSTYQANNKNLWTRLLSETGIIGFLIFVSWLISLWLKADSLTKDKPLNSSTWGFIMKIALIALLFEGFSIDSFAMPYLWLILGISASTFRLQNHMATSEEK